jgi:putative methyltransferase (TIGR04325 family)
MRLYNLWRSKGFANLMPNGKTIELLTPPFLLRAAKYWLSEWEYLPGGWDNSNIGGTAGWNDSSIADAQKQHWPRLLRNLEGPGPLGLSHFPWRTSRENSTDHNAMMTLGYVLGLVSRGRDGLSVLDWGGGVGHHDCYCRVLMPGVEFEYHCYDLPQLSDLGRSFLPDAVFHPTEAEALARQYDLILCSSSLHYFEDWHGVLTRLAESTDYLYIARLQSVHSAKSFVVVQRPYRVGYRTQFLSWFLNRAELIGYAESLGLELIREFLYSEEWCVRGAPEQGHCRGYLFRRAKRKDGKDQG